MIKQNLARRHERITASAVTEIESVYAAPGILKGRDPMMLTLVVLERMAENRIFPSAGIPISSRLIGRCAILAVDGVVRSYGGGRQQWFGRMRTLCRSFSTWTMDVRSVLMNIALGGSPSDYELHVAAAFVSAKEGFGPARDPNQLLGAARQALESLSLPSDPDEVRQALAWYKCAKLAEGGGLFRMRDGGLGLGAWQLRDGLAKDFGIKRVRPRVDEVLTYDTSCLGGDLEIEQIKRQMERQELVADLPGPGGDIEDVDVKLDNAARLARVRQIIRHRRRRPGIGRLRHAVLEHYEELKRGDLTIRELARDKGCAHSALQRAFDREDGGVLSEIEEISK